MRSKIAMKKSHFILLVSGALSLGILIGAVGIWTLSIHLSNKFMGLAAASGAGQEVTVLQLVRTGDTNHAIELLEIHLDGDVVTLGSLLGDVPPSHRDPTLMKTLARARDYRVKYPRKSDLPEGDATVAKAFDLVDTQRKR
jgi:hypothetical protein